MEAVKRWPLRVREEIDVYLFSGQDKRGGADGYLFRTKKQREKIHFCELWHLGMDIDSNVTSHKTKELGEMLWTLS